MKVECNTYKNTKFSNIKIGECFRTNFHVYIKTEDIDESDKYINAVCLETGDYTYFEDEHQVMRVKAKVVIGDG